MRVIGARDDDIYAGGAYGASGQATFSLLVQGSTPGAPPGKTCHLDCQAWHGLYTLCRLIVRLWPRPGAVTFSNYPAARSA